MSITDQTESHLSMTMEQAYIRRRQLHEKRNHGQEQNS
jgi:hypothetical protein